jgi:hypothetical protein
MQTSSSPTVSGSSLRGDVYGPYKPKRGRQRPGKLETNRWNLTRPGRRLGPARGAAANGFE